MNKKVTYIVLSLLLVSLVVVSAEEIIEIDASSYSIWDNFIHSLQDLGLFTAAGQSRECSSSADYTVTGVNGYVPGSSLLSGAGCSVALFNVFDKDWHFIGEYKSEDTAGFQVAADSTYVNYPAIIEVYCCPYEACDSDSDCDSYPASSYGDFCNTNYGSCYGDAPSHVTQMFQCQNDQWMQYGTASYGDNHFCNEGLNNYIDRNGAEHCVISSYSSVNDGVWCGSTSTDEDPACIPNENAICENPVIVGDNFYCDVDDITYCPSGDTCSNGECSSGTTPECSDGYMECRGDEVWDCINSEWENIDTCSLGCLNPSYSLAYCDSQSYFCSNGVNCFGSSTQNVNCYDTIEECMDTIGICCINEQTESSRWAVSEDCYSSELMRSGTDIDEAWCDGFYNETTTQTAVTTSITWTEFYSMSDETFSKKIKQTTCYTDADCPMVKGYNVSCEDDEIISNRLYEVSVASCDDNFGVIDELMNIIKLGIGSGSYCEMVVDIWGNEGYADTFLQWIGEKVGIESPKGYCIAESSTWYGSAWDGTLKMMGGMGLPYQYVMIITVMLLITLAGVLIRQVMG